jgi:hypothetical protein
MCGQGGLGEDATGFGDVAHRPRDGTRTCQFLLVLLHRFRRRFALDQLFLRLDDPVVEFGLAGFLHPVVHAEEKNSRPKKNEF